MKKTAPRATGSASNPITPQTSHPQLASALKLVSPLYFKREDLHPLGSHKGRSIPIMIDGAIKKGIGEFAISSSGNAALSAGLYVNELNYRRTKNSGANSDHEPITLDIFIGQKIAPKKRDKLEKLKSEFIRVSSHERPLQALFAKTQDEHKGKNRIVHGLRQSNDDGALIGYTSLAEELLMITDLRAVFVGTSSGTTAQALADYFLKHSQKTHRAPVEVHIIQTSSCHPIAEEFDDTTSDEVSIADAIVDHTALRKPVLTTLIEKTGGRGWVATNESIDIAMKLVENHANVSISPNSALAVVGLMNATYTGKTWDGAVACIITGE